MNNQSLVFSVIIPTYNRAAKLKRALESLNAQTFTRFEVLVCDDGSTDDTAGMLNRFREGIRFQSLTWLPDANWGGPAVPRNRGIRAARGEWICFLDSDDTWHPGKLAHVFARLHEADLVYHDFVQIGGGGQTKTIHARTLRSPVFRDLMERGHNACIILSGIAVRRGIVARAGGFKEHRDLIGVEDADFCLTVAHFTDRFVHLALPLGNYYFDGGNLTQFDQSMVDRLNRVYDLHAPRLPDDAARRRARRSHEYALGRIFRIQGKKREALLAFRMSSRSPNLKLAVRSLYWIARLTFRK